MPWTSAPAFLGLVCGQHQHSRPAARRNARRLPASCDLASGAGGDHRRGRIVRHCWRDFHCRTTRACAESDPLAGDLRRARQYWPDHRLATVAARLGNGEHNDRRLRFALARDDPVRHAGASEPCAGAHARVHCRVRRADADRLGLRSRHLAGDPEVVHLCVRGPESDRGRFSGDAHQLAQRLPCRTGADERGRDRDRHDCRGHRHRLGQCGRGHVALSGAVGQRSGSGGVGGVRRGHSADSAGHARRLAGGRQRPARLDLRSDCHDSRHVAHVDGDPLSDHGVRRPVAIQLPVGLFGGFDDADAGPESQTGSGGGGGRGGDLHWFNLLHADCR